MNPIYCPICKKEIDDSDARCPYCGAKTSTPERALEAKKAEYLAAAEQELERQQLEIQRAEQAALDAKRLSASIARTDGVCNA